METLKITPRAVTACEGRAMGLLERGEQRGAQAIDNSNNNTGLQAAEWTHRHTHRADFGICRTRHWADD